MGIAVIWDDENSTTIRYEVVGKWTWDDMLNAIAASNAMLEHVERNINFIYDFRASAGVPDGALGQLRRFVGNEHPKTGRQVVVGAPKSAMMMLAQGLISMVKRIYRTDWGLQFADSLEQARALLAQVEAPER